YPRLLVHARGDARTLARCHRDHRLHPCRHLLRRARSDAILWRAISRVSPPSSDVDSAPCKKAGGSQDEGRGAVVESISSRKAKAHADERGFQGFTRIVCGSFVTLIFVQVSQPVRK